MNSSAAPRASDPMEHTIHDTNEFVQLVEGHNPEDAPALLHHQPYQLTEQDPATRNEFNHAMGLVTSIDMRLTAGLNLVNASVANLQNEVRENNVSVANLQIEVRKNNVSVANLQIEVRENNEKVHEILQRIMNKLDEFRSCQCGEPGRK